MNAGLAVALFFGLAWIPVYAFRTESLSDALPDYSLSEQFWGFASVGVVTIHVAACCVTLSFSSSLSFWRTVLGVVLFGMGIAFWFWGRTAIGRLTDRYTPDQPPRSFRTNGPFGLVRNPLYFGVLIASAGTAVAAGRVVFAMTWMFCFIALAVRATQEEQRLHAQLGGAYTSYCQRVKRLIPFVW